MAASVVALEASNGPGIGTVAAVTATAAADGEGGVLPQQQRQQQQQQQQHEGLFSRVKGIQDQAGKMQVKNWREIAESAVCVCSHLLPIKCVGLLD